MTNEHILSSLNAYIENPDPRYALMLKGKWGCGKTWLVDKWIETELVNPENKEDVVLQPIRVTLYGMTKTEEITNAIDRQIHPFLYSKVAKIGANILKVAGKVVLRTDLDFNNDGKGDATLTTSLDSLSFFASKDASIKPNNPALLVFDDLERTHIPIRELLGYINYFVEYCGCHVIIVGDESKMAEEEKKTLDDFKEKTVGREFKVEPDIDAAIKNFVSEIPQLPWLEKQCDFIRNVFASSKCDNLRILRQSLYDFKIQYLKADQELIEKDRNVMRELLGSFIATYCEYKGANKSLLKKWSERGLYYLCLNTESPENVEMRNLESRYDADKHNGVNVLNQNHISKIVEHIEKGCLLKDYIDSLLKADQSAVGVLDRLTRFREMEDDVFEKDCDELAKELEEGKYRQFYPIGRALAFFSLFEKKDIYKVDESVLDKVKSTMKDLFTNEVKDLDTLYQCQTAFLQAMNTVENSNNEYRIHNEFIVFFNEVFTDREKQLPDRMQKALNELSNKSVNELFKIDDSSIPNRYSAYSMTPILAKQNPSELFERIKGLSNEKIREFALFLNHHYKLGYQLASDYSNYFHDDLATLTALRDLTSQEASNARGIKAMALTHLQGVICKCIERANGERQVL